MVRILSALSVLLFCVTAQAAGLDHVRLGMQAEREGKYRTAISHYDRAIADYFMRRTDGEEIAVRADEVKYIQGLHEGEIKSVLVPPETSKAANYAFDVTPARLVSGLITERGVCAASEEGVLGLYPEKKSPV